MNGLDLLLEISRDYEWMHQLVLYALLKKSTLPLFLFDMKLPIEVIWEPEGQLFDLAVKNDITTKYIELKMWSSLTKKQMERQISFLKDNHCRSYYVLLGTSSYEFSNNKISKDSNGKACRLSYQELIDSLNKIIKENKESAEIQELAASYLDTLQEQYEEIKNAYKKKGRFWLLGGNRHKI
jgi:hypothetical protein